MPADCPFTLVTELKRADRLEHARHAKGACFAEGENETTREEYSGGAAARPDADGGTACLAYIARTGAPRGAAPPHSVTIQA